MASAVDDQEAQHAAAVGRRYLLQFEMDTLKQRRLWVRLIIEFLGTFFGMPVKDETEADQNERDYTALQTAVKDGKAEATTEI